MEEMPVRVGSGQLTVLEVVPGLAGETLRMESALRRLQPTVVAVDAALPDVTRARESWYAAVVRAGMADHGHRESASPQLSAAKLARLIGAEIVPALGAPEAPGFFARRRALRAVTGGRLSAPDPRALAASIRNAAAEADVSVKRLLHLAEESMARRLGTLLLEEQRTRVAFVVTYPRSERVAGLLLGRPVATEVARLGHGGSR